jgi:glucosylceramidase
MKQQGINIYAVSPQNEPLNKANCASLYMPWQEEAPFVAELASAFKKNGINTKIYLFDHNYNYDNIEDQQDYPVKVYNALGNEFEGSELVVGSAYHDYGGKNTELTDIHTQAPDKELIFSESSIGTWNDGRNLSKRLMEDMKNVTLGTVNQWCKAVLVWNLMLDMNMGPNLDGGCQTCFGAVDISMDYKTITRNSHYYVISHMSSVVRPDAQRIGVSQRSLVKNGLVYSAFRNPDGTYATVVLNSSDENVTAVISDGQNHFRTVIPAQGVVSCKW